MFNAVFHIGGAITQSEQAARPGPALELLAVVHAHVGEQGAVALEPGGAGRAGHGVAGVEVPPRRARVPRHLEAVAAGEVGVALAHVAPPVVGHERRPVPEAPLLAGAVPDAVALGGAERRPAPPRRRRLPAPVRLQPLGPQGERRAEKEKGNQVLSIRIAKQTEFHTRRE